MSGLIQTVGPAGEPLDLATTKAYLRVDADDTTQDGIIQELIGDAREYVERWSSQQMLTATWVLTLDRFPYRQPGVTWQWPGEVWDRQNASWLEGLTIRLPRPPLQAIQQITYIDPTGTTQVVPTANYLVDNQSYPGRIMPPFGQIWPITLVVVNAVQVTYQAGYGPYTTIAAGIPSTGSQTVTPGTMTGIAIGTQLDIDVGTAKETVSVTGTTASTFTANFNGTHAANVVCVGAIPKVFRRAMRLYVTTAYEQRMAGAVDMSHVDKLLWAAESGQYT